MAETARVRPPQQPRQQNFQPYSYSPATSTASRSSAPKSNPRQTGFSSSQQQQQQRQQQQHQRWPDEQDARDDPREYLAQRPPKSRSQGSSSGGSEASYGSRPTSRAGSRVGHLRQQSVTSIDTSEYRRPPSNESAPEMPPLRSRDMRGMSPEGERPQSRQHQQQQQQQQQQRSRTPPPPLKNRGIRQPQADSYRRPQPAPASITSQGSRSMQQTQQPQQAQYRRSPPSASVVSQSTNATYESRDMPPDFNPSTRPGPAMPRAAAAPPRRKQVPRAPSVVSTDTRDTRDTSMSGSPRKDSTDFGGSFVDDMTSPTLNEGGSPMQRAGPAMGNDIIARHLLLDTALNDSQDFQILSMDEVDEHKTKLKRLNNKIYQERRKLAMEMKVQHAAQNLYKLYENSVSPTTARKKNRHAMSILIDSKRSAGHELNQSLDASKDEEFKTERKIHELQQFINGMTSDKAIRESTLLRHSAAVLMEAYHDESDHKQNGGDRDGADSEATLINNSREIVDEFLAPSGDRYNVLQGRLESLNSHITAAIDRYRSARDQVGSEMKAKDETDSDTRDPVTRMTLQITQLERNIYTLDHECSPTKMNADIDATLRAMAARTETTLQGLQQNVDEPLPLKRVETQTLIGHLNKNVEQLERLLQPGSEIVEEHKRALDEKSAQVEGLADKLRRIFDGHNLGTATGQGFDLHGFDTAVLQRFELMNERNSILQEQLRQQRELPAQASGEHTRAMTDLQSTHSELQEMHTDLQLRHQTAESQMLAMKQDGENAMTELERIRALADAQAEQKQKAINESMAQQARIKELESEIHEYAEELEGYREQGPRDSGVSAEDSQRMHEKIVDLSSELAEAKAELDRARGSRAERAKDVAITPEVQAQLERVGQLERERSDMSRELSAMASEHQELTRETIQVEKDREQLEGVVDGWREKCQALESQLDEEKVRWLGMKSPGSHNTADGAKQSTSTAVLKAEFKKMIRATRAECDRKLKAEQEERRRLEVQIREMKKERLTALRSPGLTAEA